MKKTIEEVAQEYLRNTDINPFSAINDGFIAGAKYQSEQSKAMGLSLDRLVD